VKSCVSRTDSLITQTFASGARCVVDTGTARQNVEAARSLYLESSNIGLPPYECRDVAERFADVMALADNAFIYADPTRKDDFQRCAVGRSAESGRNGTTTEAVGGGGAGFLSRDWLLT